MSKSIQDYFPVKCTNRTMVQGRVPTTVVSHVKEIMHSKGLSWSEVLTACLTQLIDNKPAQTQLPPKRNARR